MTKEKVRNKMVTCMGLPMMGPIPDELYYDGIHLLEEITVKRVTYRPGYVEIKNGELIAVGLQPHLLMKV